MQAFGGFFCLFVSVFFFPFENFTLMVTSSWRMNGFKFWNNGHSLPLHIYYETVRPFIKVISEDPWHSHVLPSACQSSCHYYLKRLSLSRPVIETRPYACGMNALPMRHRCGHWRTYRNYIFLKISGCVSQKYGKNCSLLCPQNCLKSRCDIDTGACLSCITGYTGQMCTEGNKMKSILNHLFLS